MSKYKPRVGDKVEVVISYSSQVKVGDVGIVVSFSHTSGSLKIDSFCNGEQFYSTKLEGIKPYNPMCKRCNHSPEYCICEDGRYD